MEKFLPIEKEIARELKIKPAQIMEWSTTPVEAHAGEILAKTIQGIYVAYKPAKSV